MRVLAAAFESATAARSVLEELRRRYRLRPTDVSIAPLGTGDGAVARTVLAGRFYDDAVSDIEATVERHGGQVVSDVDERWTRSPAGHESLETEADARQH
jgi:hypothetical protein